MSEREAAYKAYLARQKSKNPSAFDTMGAFNNYYNDAQNVTSLAVPLDFGKSIPKNERAALLEQFDATTRTAPKSVVPASMQPAIAGSGFWTKLFAGMERAYNLSAQAASFALTLPEPTNPLYQDANVIKNVRESWKSARQISPGQAFQTAVGGTILGAPLSLVEEAPAANKFIDENALFLSSEFNVFDQEQRQKAFRDQTLGRWSSFTTDVIARFTIDPFIIGGKAVKAVRGAKLAVKPGELRAVMAGEVTGKRAERIKGDLQSFVEATDNMNESDLFRVKAIRESASPAAISDVIATANKIEDKALRHATKTNIVMWAMGDAKAAEALITQSDEIAAKIGNLQDEISEAKYLGAGVDKKTGQFTMDLMNDGVNYEKAQVLTNQYQDAIDKVYQRLNVEGALDPRKLPEVNIGSALRQEFSNSQSFIDVRAGAASIPVRVMTGFFYKRPRGWIDFTDNQSLQTLDNMLSQVRNVSARQVESYNKILNGLKVDLQMAGDDAAKTKAIKDQMTEVQERINRSTFTVERKNELFARYVEAPDANARARAYMSIEEDVFNTIGDQFGFSKEQIRQAWGTYGNARARTHNLIRERVYTSARDPETGGPAGGIVKPIIGSDGTPLVFPAPLNETQLVKQLPTLDVNAMYAVLNRATRPQRFEYFGEKYRLPVNKVGKAFKAAYQAVALPRRAANEMVDSLDALLKFEVLARIGYPIRNVTEGNMRILFTVGPMAIINRAAGLLKATGKNIIQDRFVGSTNKEIFEWSNNVKLLTKKAELEASKNYADDPDLIASQIKEIDGMLEGKVKIYDRYGMGLNKIQVGDEVITYQDALGATPAQAKYYNERFIANAARIVDDHFSESGRKMRNLFETNGDWTDVPGSDPGWVDTYLRVVNRQIRNSKLTSILLQDKPREVLITEATKFLTKNPEGRQILRNLAIGRDVEKIVEANMLNVEQVFPAWISPELKKIASQRNITADDIEKYYGTEVKLRPTINGAQVSAANGTSSFSTLLASTLDSFYNAFGEIPERGLTRNPFYIDLYRKRMKASVENAIANYPGEEIPGWYLRKLENQSRQWARAEMRRNLYDTSERVESAQYLKYAFPFFGAFADVAEKWGRIVFDDPSVIRSLQTVYESPDRMGMTEEKDGITYINVPGKWADRMFPGKDNRPFAIPKPSLNLIFQGGNWWNPGAGWFVQFIASKFVKKTPELERNALVKEILPYGATGTGWKDLLIQSPAAKRAMGLFDDENKLRKNLTVLVMAEENAKYDQGLRDTKPTITEINDRVKWQIALEVGARLILPFATSTRSPYQYYIDAFQTLREEDPLTATDKFYEKYGDSFYLFTTSLSKNNTGIAATIEADKVATQFADLIAKKPEYGWFITGPANAGEFSPTVYRKQFETPVAPGSTVTYRTSQDAFQAVAETNAERGWIKYNKGMDVIEAIRIQRNLPSLTSRGAEDLRIAKQALVQALEQENPDWASARGQIDLGKVTNFLKFAKEAVADPRLANRPDMKTMASYLEGREIIRGFLATRPNKSINSQSNADLKEAWDAVIGALVDQDVTFNRIYTRILENDDLTKGL